MAEQTLEELVGKEATNELAKELVVKPLIGDPNRDYERGRFAAEAADLFDLEEHYGKLSQNPGDCGALKDLVEIAAKYLPEGTYQENYYTLLKDKDKAMRWADILLSDGYIKMAQHVDKNRSKFFDLASFKQLFQMFSRSSLFDTKDEEHDRIIKLRNKVMQIEQARRNHEDIGDVVEEEFKELVDRAPDAQRQYITMHIEDVRKSITRHIVKRIHQEYSSLFRDKEGKEDKNALIKYLERNYEVIEDEIKNYSESNKKQEAEHKLKIWDKNIKPLNVDFARIIREPEEKAQKMEDYKEWETEKGRLYGIKAAA